MAHFGPEEAIARIDDWKGHDVRYEELGGGITNHNYIVWVDGGPPQGRKYVLRVPGTGTDMFIDREVERYNMVQAAAAGVGPAVAYQIDPEGALVSDFVEGELMHPDTIAGHPDRIRQVVQTVKTVHEKAVFKHRIQVFDMIRHYTDVAHEVNAPIPPELASLLKEMDVIERATSVRPPRDVACHNDLLSENFIVDAGGKMWLIDWEYGGMTDPYFDLGDFVMEHAFTRDEQRLIIEAYCGHMDEGRFGRMMLYKVVTGVWWGVWAMIQKTVSHIDFDYWEWGMDRIVDRSQVTVDDPDYPKWLAEC
jgi:thiamine kinase-like enzyme